MRTFIALLFDDEPRDIIYDILGEVRTISESGTFTSKKNLHLTLLYVGEASEEVLESIKEKLSEINLKGFDYQTNRIKYFRKSNSRLIVYLGVDKTEELQNLYTEIRVKLKEMGLHFHSEKYTPHITLGRQVKVKKNKSIHNVYCNTQNLRASRISIMESKRVNNKLVYEELYSIPLI